VVRWAFTGLSQPGLVLGCIAVIVMAGLILAAMTSGFREANRHRQMAQLALLGAGAVAAVPLVWVATIAAAVIALVVAIGVAVIAVAVVILGAMLDA
jgi:hypothetical protein